MPRAGLLSRRRAGAYQTEVTADGPLVYYPLGEPSGTPIDTAGGSAIVTVSGMTLGAAGVGDRATSAAFTAGNASFGQPSALNGMNSFTVEGLFNVNAVTAFQNIVARTAASAQRWYLSLNTNKAFVAMFQPNGGGSITVQGSTVVTANANHHLAFTSDGTTLTLYLDGVSQGTVSVTGGQNSGNTGVDNCFGGGASANNAMSGKIGGVAIYNKTLSTTRIFAHAHAAGVV